MRSSICALSVAGSAAITLLLGMSSPTPMPNTSATTNPNGSYFVETVNSSGQALNAFIALHVGGTLTGGDMSDFGAAGVYNSTMHGTWKVVAGQLHAVGYYFQIDPATSLPVGVIRIDATGSLDTGQGTATVDYFAPFANPTTEPPTVAGVDSLTMTFYRLPN